MGDFNGEECNSQKDGKQILGKKKKMLVLAETVVHRADSHL